MCGAIVRIIINPGVTIARGYRDPFVLSGKLCPAAVTRRLTQAAWREVPSWLESTRVPEARIPEVTPPSPTSSRCTRGHAVPERVTTRPATWRIWARYDDNDLANYAKPVCLSEAKLHTKCSITRVIFHVNISCDIVTRAWLKFRDF